MASEKAAAAKPAPEPKLVPSGIVYKDGLAVDPVIPTRLITPPSQGGPGLISGHTPGCRNAYGDALDDNGKRIGKGCKPSECECQGKYAEG